MYLTLDHYEDAYDRIRDTANQFPGTETVLIFVGPEVDAVCACLLLVTQLRADWIAHKIEPVATYTALASAATAMLSAAAAPHLHSLVLINCGGIVAIRDVLDDLLMPHHRVYVVESRRPLALDNLFGDEAVMVLDDGHVAKDLVDEKDAYLLVQFGIDAGAASDSSGDGESGSDGESVDGKESDASAHHRPSKKRRRTDTNDDPTLPLDSDREITLGLDDDDDDGDSRTDDGDDAEDEDDQNGNGSDAENRHMPEPPPNQQRTKLSRDIFSTLDASDSDDDDTVPITTLLEAMDPSAESAPPPLPPLHDAATPRRKRKRRHRSPGRTRKPSRGSGGAGGRRMALRAAESTLNAYSTQGMWTGTAASYCMYQLIVHLGRATLDSAWLAIIGVTAQAVGQEVARERYEELVLELDAQVANLATAAAVATTTTSASSNETTATVDLQSLLSGGVGLPGTVARVTDWWLPLYRHWTLYDSMMAAPEISARISAWTDGGVSRLRFLFAKLGVAVDEYAKPFTHMDRAVKATLGREFATQAPVIGIDPSLLERTAFTRVTAAGGIVVAAADVVYALEALASTSASSHTAAEATDPASARAASAFYAQVDALQDDVQLLAGIERAKPMVAAVQVLAGTLVQRRAVKTLRGLRYVLVRDVGDAAGALTSPWGVRMLAIALAAALREIGRAELPLVVGVLQQQQQPQGSEELYLLVGHAFASQEGKVRRNPFGIAFQLAAQATNTRHSHDAFDPAVVWVVKDDVTEFVEQLQVHLGAAPF
ncbi:CDC45 family [Blastocladiella britannica]|nr:CDC45 family [Blastocladiella britannica]